MRPPKPFLHFFRWFCHPKLQKYIEGDLMELYEERLKLVGRRKADIKFIIDIILLFRPGIIRSAEGTQNLNTYGMYLNHLKVGWRNITHKKVYALINVSGLALGIACAIIIFSLINYHLNFDNFHSDANRIYRFVTDSYMEDVNYEGSVPPAFGKAFREDYTFADKVARICKASGIVTLDKVQGENKFQESPTFADPEFFTLFNFPLVQGNLEGILNEPNTAVITETIEKKYFGNESAMGKTFRFDNRIDFTITGVLKDIPDNTDFGSDIFFSYSTIQQFSDWVARDDSWGGITSDVQTFARLNIGVNPFEVEEVLPAYVKKFRAKSKNVHHYKLQPLSEVHFDARYGGQMDRKVIYVLTGVGFFLVFTACLNFINLATAQALTRSKEMGIRKTLGSVRSQLFAQFTVETALVVLLATLVALGIVYSVMPVLNEFFNSHIELNLFSDLRLLLFLAGLMIGVTLLSSSYPGLVLSGFQPVLALKGKLSSATGGSFDVRKGLVITQFTISQVLLIGLIVMFSQMRYFQEIDMGFNKDAVVIIPVGSRDVKMTTLKDQFLQISDVENVSICFAPPASDNQWTTSFAYDNRSESENFFISFRGADEDYLTTFEIDLLAGRNLIPSDTIREYLVNESVVKKLGLASLEDILGKSIRVNGWTAPVVGIVRDFHDQSLRSEINPVCITTSINNYNVYSVKIKMLNASETLASLEKAWSGMYPEHIFDYVFLDDHIASFYQAEESMLKMVQIFSFIALFIGCMGLYGLVSFMAVQKTKEIGIRKVLGGSIAQILWIFGQEFSRLVFIAFLIATPLGWLLMSNWLSLYSYPINLSAWFFLLEFVIIFMVVILTVGYQSLKAALANPVSSLRSE